LPKLFLVTETENHDMLEFKSLSIA